MSAELLAEVASAIHGSKARPEARQLDMPTGIVRGQYQQLGGSVSGEEETDVQSAMAVASGLTRSRVLALVGITVIVLSASVVGWASSGRLRRAVATWEPERSGRGDIEFAAHIEANLTEQRGFLRGEDLARVRAAVAELNASAGNASVAPNVSAALTASVAASGGFGAQGLLAAASGAVLGALDQVATILHLRAQEAEEAEAADEAEEAAGAENTSTVTTTPTTTTPQPTEPPTATATATATTTTTWTSTHTTSTHTTSTVSTTTTKLSSIFCYMVVRVKSFEIPLAEVLYEKRASIFSCDAWRVLSNGGPANIRDYKAVVIKQPQVELGNLSKSGTTTSSWLNTMIFMEAWELIFDDGEWWNHDWTVKVDPDAVFFPDRLKVRLQPYYPPGDFNGPALYVANCDRTWNGAPPELKLFGSLEIFSRNALGMYRVHKNECKKYLPWKGWGEDLFISECMKMMKVGVVNGVDFLGDQRCHYAPCWDQSKVAFHAFKDIPSWMDCWGQSHPQVVVNFK